MTHHVLTSGFHRRPVSTLVGSRPEVDDIPGPAILFDSDGGMDFDSGRPVAVREDGEDWSPVPVELADVWVRLSRRVRGRLVADPDVSLSADEVANVAAAGGSVSAVYWVGSDSEDADGFHVSGDLASFVRLLSSLSRE